jgi:hypothetical protein
MFKHRGLDSLARSRWAAIGAAVAVAVGAGGAGWVAHAAPGPTASVFVSITPCRLFDTRPSTQVADRATPLDSGETWTRPVWGSNGQCTIPSTATSISYNLTIPDPTVTGFMTLYPADVSRPGSSSINPVANGGTKANSGIVGLSAAGAMNIYNHAGPIDAVMDVTGYYVAGGAGATGPAGAAGAAGAAGPQGLAAWDTIPSGQTVTGEIIYDAQSAGSLITDGLAVNLPGVAPVALDAAHVNFGKLSGASDADAACDGTDIAHPTAPRGMVCIYMDPGSTSSIDLTKLSGDVFNMPTRAFFVAWTPNGAAGDDEFIYASWAYTAP